jgi:transcriptional regulator GlxA family with amidase domain
MCTNGVNTTQLASTIEIADESVSMSRRWVHRLFHTADDAGFADVASKLKEAQTLLDEVRAALDEAKEASLETSPTQATVELV